MSTSLSPSETDAIADKQRRGDVNFTAREANWLIEQAGVDVCAGTGNDPSPRALLEQKARMYIVPHLRLIDGKVRVVDADGVPRTMPMRDGSGRDQYVSIDRLYREQWQKFPGLRWSPQPPQ